MITDDPTVIEPTLEALKKTFATGKTRSLDFRKQQLQNLARGMKEMTDEFGEAFSKDLGYRDKFYSNFWQMTLPIAHIEHLVKNIYSLNKVRKVDTTMFCAIGILVYFYVQVRVISSLSLLVWCQFWVRGTTRSWYFILKV